MKKKLSVFLAGLMLLSVLTACGETKKEEPTAASPKASEAATASDDSLNYIKGKGELIIGLDDSFAPMGFRDEKGELVGFDIDMAKAVGEGLGVSVKFQPIDWDALVMEINSKNIDLVWNGMSSTPERQEKLNLSDPYLNNTLVIMTKNDSIIKKKSQLKGKSIGVQSGSSGLKVVESDPIYSEIKDYLVEYKNYDEALMDLENGRLDAVIVDKVLGKYKSSKKPDTYTFADEDFGEDLYVIGMRKGDNALTEAINGALKKVIASGKAKEISQKWFGDDVVIKK